MNVVLKASSEKRNNTHVFPTPESPISNNLKRIQEHFAAVQSREDPAEQDARLVAPVVTEEVARVDDLQFEQLVPLPGANVEVPT
jgi:hypothetical protein